MASFSGALKLKLTCGDEYLRTSSTSMMMMMPRLCSSINNNNNNHHHQGGRRGAAKVKAAIKFKGTQMREQQLTQMIEEKVLEAKQVCGQDETSDECKVAWDEVEEVSQAKAHLRLKLEMDKQDPLQSFCQENPETDECRIYED